jgi:hypothetical protein
MRLLGEVIPSPFLSVLILIIFVLWKRTYFMISILI